MDDDQRDLVNRLFATATALLEDAIEVAAAGQSSRCSVSELPHHGRRLRTAVHDISLITEAAEVVARIKPEDDREKS